VLAPSDTLILCSNELAVKQIMPTVRNVRRPERLAVDLAKATAQYDTDQPSGVIALNWRVDKVGQAVKQLGLVLVIFLCVTLAMQSVIQLNQRVNRWMAVYAETGPVRQPPILGYRPNSVASSVPATSAELTQTVQARALVRVHVNVNMEVASPSVVATFVPTLMPLANSVEHSRIALQPPPTLPVTSTPDPTNVPTVMLFVPAPSPTILTPTIPPPALSTALLIPTVPIALVENSVPPVDTVAAELPLVSSAPTVTHVSLLAPPAEASSAGVMNFAWQSDLALPPGQAYEVIIWQDNQSPLADGLGIAAPIQEEHLTVQLEGLYAAGVIRPGAYQWGLLLVTVEPYTRVALLSSGRTFYFAATSQAPACDPDRATC